jgi:hypothetical protein
VFFKQAGALALRETFTGACMKKLIPTLAAAGILFGLAAAPAVAQTGLGGAKERNMPSTVGSDPRPDRETMKARKPMMRAIQPHARMHHRHYGYGPRHYGYRSYGPRYYGDRYYAPRYYGYSGGNPLWYSW